MQLSKKRSGPTCNTSRPGGPAARPAVAVVFLLYLLIGIPSFAADPASATPTTTATAAADVPPAAEPEMLDPDMPPALGIGSSPRQISLESMTGARLSFPTPGRWTLVFFWSLFCHSCLEEMPVIQGELKKIPPERCDAYFITLDGVKMKTGVNNYLVKRSFNCNVLFEELASDTFLAADAYGVTTTPATFLLDESGKAVFVRVGPFDLEELLTALRKIPGAGTATGTAPATGTTSGS